MKIIESYISDSKQNLFYEEALAYKKFLSDKRHITIFGWNPEAFVCIEKPNHNLFRLCTLYRAWENYLIDNDSDPYYSLPLWKDVRNI